MPGYQFANTRWSLIQTLRESDPSAAQRALDELCQVYWYPLYAFVRRSGRSHHEAEDLTQSYFAHLLDKEMFSDANAEKGRLRNFLLTGLKRFMINHYHYHQREKRGGADTHLSLATIDANERYEQALTDSDSPEKVYQREWALTLLDQVLSTLREEMIARGQGPFFEKTKDRLTGENQATGYQDVAESLGWSVSAVKVAVHRMRRRYRQLLQRRVTETLTDASQADEEIAAIAAALRK